MCMTEFKKLFVDYRILVSECGTILHNINYEVKKFFGNIPKLILILQ